MSHHIVFLDRATLPERIQLPGLPFPHTWQEYEQTQPQEIIPRLQQATIAIVNKVKLGHNELAALPALQLIVVAATGTDNVDRAACQAHGVTLCNVQGYAVHAVVEHALALMLALSRNLLPYQQALKAGAWQQSPHFCYFGPSLHDLAGKRLGLIGSGSLGEAMARIGSALGMEVCFAERRHASAPRRDKNGEWTRLPFETLLATADVLSLHCPLNDETRGMIGARELALMKPTALLINTARGGLVDESALLQALTCGELAGAASDVAGREPPQEGDPLLRALALPNFILTPHVAWASDDAMQTLADQVMENVARFVAGDPVRRIV
ncbi:MAG: D-2-hydroxyacid dehydrogenase [Aeromonadaceae bacterium]